MHQRLLAAALCVCVAAIAPGALAQQASPGAGSASTVVTGGTAIVAVGGPVRGCYITNPASATDQGIGAAESLYVDPAKAATLTGNGSNTALVPGQSWSCPASMASGSNVSVNATTSGHKLTVVVW